MLDSARQWTANAIGNKPKEPETLIADIPWLIHWAYHVCPVLTSMFCKGIHIAVKAVKHSKVERYPGSFRPG